VNRPLQATARALLLLAVAFFSACQTAAPTPPPAPATASASLAPSPHRVIGRVIGLDPLRELVVIELTGSLSSLPADTELIARSDDLRETARLRATRQLRGRTLGTTVISGEPSLGDEVVLDAP
jgi:hypothetical protein